jgi:hypothetical protein
LNFFATSRSSSPQLGIPTSTRILCIYHIKMGASCCPKPTEAQSPAPSATHHDHGNGHGHGQDRDVEDSNNHKHEGCCEAETTSVLSDKSTCCDTEECCDSLYSKQSF